MRIVKEASVRKNEILDAAKALFAEKGFDHTSTNDILDAVGIARGTLYHHFKSKEEIMDAIIERQSGLMLENAKKVAMDKSIPVKERMIQTILSLSLEEESESGNHEMIEHLHKPQNALMHQKAKQIIMRHVPPVLAEILKEGIAQGLFSTPYPLECMEMVISYSSLMFDDDVLELTAQQRLGRIQALIFQMERMLGVEEGGLSFVTQMFREETK